MLITIQNFWYKTVIKFVISNFFVFPRGDVSKYLFFEVGEVSKLVR